MSKKLLEIGIQKRNKELQTSWNELAETYGNGKFVDGESYRQWTKSELRKIGQLKPKTVTTIEGEVESPNYKETVEIKSDGSHYSDKLLRMSAEQSKDVNFLLSAHGYDNKTWELISARSNIWNIYSKIDKVQTLYSSKISVKPLTANKGNVLDDILKAIENVRPVYIEVDSFTPEDNFLLEIPLFDQHFGISDYEYYKKTQADIFDKVNSRKWKEILFVIGQDLFHNNDFKGNTANGTHIEVIDMEKAWDDCCKFYEPLIGRAIKQSINVKVMYSKGNHDETISWGFVKYLQGKFPQAEFDCSFIERKIHTFGEIFIGITHGDKANNKELANIFNSDFALPMAMAKIKEIHKGHFHVEDGKDVFGTMVRTLATRNKSDKWHTDKGFIGAHKRFMLFEYSETELKTISYV